VLEALKAGRRKFHELYFSREIAGTNIKKILKLAESINTEIITHTPSQLSHLTENEMHQGVAARVSRYSLLGMKEIVDNVRSQGANSFILLMDQIVDPHNLGALIRTALCAGIESMIIPRDRAAGPTPAVSRASAGALEHVTLAAVTNMVHAIKELKQEGLWIAGMDGEATQTIYNNDLTCPLGIIIGSEERGIRQLVKKNCDFLMSIPQTGPVNSLNASVAGGIVMYEVLRQRRALSNDGKK